MAPDYLTDLSEGTSCDYLTRSPGPPRLRRHAPRASSAALAGTRSPDGDARRHLGGAADGDARPDHRQRRAPTDPDRTRLLPREPLVGAQRLQPGLRRTSPARCPDG